MTPQAESVLDLFRATGAYLEGHFRLTSGLHSPNYLQCALVLRHPSAAEDLGRRLAAELRTILDEPAALVVSPALGGLIIGHEVARALGTPFLFTERDPETRKMLLRRGFTVQPGETAVVVEDVITTGGSTRDVIEVLQRRRRPRRRRRLDHRSQRRRGRASAYRAWRWPRCRWRLIVPRSARCAGEGIPVVKPGSRPA